MIPNLPRNVYWALFGLYWAIGCLAIVAIDTYFFGVRSWYFFPASCVWGASIGAWQIPAFSRFLDRHLT